MKFIISLIIFLILIGSVQAISDNLFFSIPNNTIQCVDIILPDDMDVLEEGIKGIVGYRIETTIGEWGDLTEQIVWTDENNTAIIPLCFRVSDKKTGECSKPFNITISAPEINKTKTWKGGICVSGQKDVDAAPEGNDTREVLNTKKDIFDIGLKKYVRYGNPGEDVVFSVLLESYADLKIIVSANSSANVYPEREVVSLNKENPKRVVEFRVSGEEGEYVVDITANILNCYEDYCRKSVEGKLIVSEEPERSGFSISIFPDNINVKYLDPVLFELTISNFGEKAEFKTELSTILENDFVSETIEINSGEENTIYFTVTPEEYSALYELKVTVKSGNTTKHATAYLTTNEILSDAEREMEEAKAGADRESKEDIDNSFGRFLDRYRKDVYGKELDSYKDLKTSLKTAKPVAGNLTNQSTFKKEREFNWILVIIPVVIAALVIVFVVLYKRGLLFQKEEFF